MDGYIKIPLVVLGVETRLDKLKEMLMATQQQINDLVTRIDTGVAAIRADIAELKAANPELDLTALEASVSQIEGLDAENPQPPA